MPLYDDPHAMRALIRNIRITFANVDPLADPWFCNNVTATQRVLNDRPPGCMHAAVKGGTTTVLSRRRSNASHNTTTGPVSSTSGAANLFADDTDISVINATHRTQSPEPIAHLASPKPLRIALDIDSRSSKPQPQNESKESMTTDDGRKPTTLGEVIRFALQQASLPLGMKRKPLRGPIDSHERNYVLSLRSIGQPVLVPKSRPKGNNAVICPPLTTTTQRGETSSGGSSSSGPRKSLGTQNPAPVFPQATATSGGRKRKRISAISPPPIEIIEISSDDDDDNPNLPSTSQVQPPGPSSSASAPLPRRPVPDSSRRSTLDAVQTLEKMMDHLDVRRKKRAKIQQETSTQQSFTPSEAQGYRIGQSTSLQRSIPPEIIILDDSDDDYPPHKSPIRPHPPERAVH